MGRRSLLAIATAVVALPAVAEEASELQTYSIKELEEAAFGSYADRDFVSTDKLLDEILRRQPEVAKWWEMRAQVRGACGICMAINRHLFII